MLRMIVVFTLMVLIFASLGAATLILVVLQVVVAQVLGHTISAASWYVPTMFEAQQYWHGD